MINFDESPTVSRNTTIQGAVQWLPSTPAHGNKRGVVHMRLIRQLRVEKTKVAPIVFIVYVGVSSQSGEYVARVEQGASRALFTRVFNLRYTVSGN